MPESSPSSRSSSAASSPSCSNMRVSVFRSHALPVELRGAAGGTSRSTIARVTRVSLLVAASVALVACGSSGTHTAQPTTTTSPPRSSTSAPTTTQPVTSTTHVNAVAADQLTQLVLTTAINAAQSIYQQSYDYTSVSPASLSSLVPNVQFGALEQASTRIVGVLAQDRNDVLLVARSVSGRWYC